METISSSIFVLAGSILVAVGGLIQHGDTQMFVMGLGCLVGAVGMLAWVGNLLNRIKVKPYGSWAVEDYEIKRS